MSENIGGWVRIKRSRPWWSQQLKQLIWSNCSSPNLARQGRNPHKSELDPVHVGDSCIAGTNWGATHSGTRIYPYCFYCHFGSHSLWMDTLLSLHIVRRTMVLPQINVCYSIWGIEGDGVARLLPQSIQWKCCLVTGSGQFRYSYPLFLQS